MTSFFNGVLAVGAVAAWLVMWFKGLPGKDKPLSRSLLIFAAAIAVQLLIEKSVAFEDIYAISKTPAAMEPKSLAVRLSTVRELTQEDLDVLGWLESLGPDGGRIYRLTGPQGMKCSWCVWPLAAGESYSSLSVNFMVYTGMFNLFRTALDFFTLAFAAAHSIHSSRWFKVQCLILIPPLIEFVVKANFIEAVKFNLISVFRATTHSNLLMGAALLVYLEERMWASARSYAPENILAKANSSLAYNMRNLGALYFMGTLKGRDGDLGTLEQKYWEEQEGFVQKVWKSVDKKSPPSSEDTAFADNALATLTSRDGSQVGYTLGGTDPRTLRRILGLPQ
ncbi:hypothetical protein B9G98_03027 [Wickerhamiella sorbophila]|uniref:Uncharacterized protein n=1 Tax=Wickerhamiella sorbophila TaxID=45607 RepID=A0A2T0FKB5_9ASCO|nr:hypothetical protein B9G98_03027 [Wickerhamiella sorbophila]PRT55407.1 hypothetical protein B9G98_03027 [Wickerhamiella sorbophila]